MSVLHGVYTGSVIDNRDPQQLARVLVRVPAVAETQRGVTPSGIEIVAPVAIKLTASAIELNASSVSVQTAMARVDGVVQCDTLITNAVVASSYTPGAGNIW
jgi:hypothetical protein